MQYSHQSYNQIEDECWNKQDCDYIVQFSKPELMPSIGTFDQTYYEMGSTQTKPCQYKSSTVTSMEVKYTKKGSQFRG